MNEVTSNEVIRLWYGGTSRRRIARQLGLNRKSGARVLAQHQNLRAGLPLAQGSRRPSLLDPFSETITQMVIDEFGFDRVERSECPQAAPLLYKIIAARNQKRSTALVTNVDFDKWGDYLPDGPIAMAFLDRLVEGAIILKIKGKSYRAHRPKDGDKPE
jgi:hypothetical protein